MIPEDNPQIDWWEYSELQPEVDKTADLCHKSQNQTLNQADMSKNEWFGIVGWVSLHPKVLWQVWIEYHNSL